MAGSHAFSDSKNFAYVGADTPEELVEKLSHFNNTAGMEEQIARFASITASAESMNKAVAAVKEAMPGTTTVNPAPAAAAPKPPPAPMNEATSSEGETETDRWGKKFVYNLPNAPMTPDGRRAVLKDWVSQGGKHLKRWVDPLDGPRSHNYQGPKWDGDWAN